ncbi:MAG: hypothetical protein QOD92_4205 [Acidimicrobiaceae bacterium]|jgi:uncharacterized linocin/CFP29 family protein
MPNSEAQQAIDDVWEVITGRFSAALDIAHGIRQSLDVHDQKMAAHSVDTAGAATRADDRSDENLELRTRPIQLMIDVARSFALKLDDVRDAKSDDGRVRLNIGIDKAAIAVAADENRLLLHGTHTNAMKGLKDLAITESPPHDRHLTVNRLATAVERIDHELYGASLDNANKSVAESIDLVVPTATREQLKNSSEVTKKFEALLHGGAIREGHGVDGAVVIAANHPAVRLVVGRPYTLQQANVTKTHVTIWSTATIALVAMSETPPVVLLEPPCELSPYG